MIVYHFNQYIDTVIIIIIIIIIIKIFKFVQVLLKIYGMGSEFFRKKLEVRICLAVYKRK